jgi:hypothetical protein
MPAHCALAAAIIPTLSTAWPLLDLLHLLAQLLLLLLLLLPPLLLFCHCLLRVPFCKVPLGAPAALPAAQQQDSKGRHTSIYCTSGGKYVINACNRLIAYARATE